jgi:hypothetical protein
LRDAANAILRRDPGGSGRGNRRCDARAVARAGCTLRDLCRVDALQYGLATYHAGVEWGFWEGPAACAPSVGVNNAADMLNQLTMHAPSCTDATWRLLGLSFAGWNTLISALLAGLGLLGLARSLQRRSEAMA